MSKLLAAIATLTGTLIGAGFLGIPFVIAKSGFIIGLVYIILIGLILMFTRLYLGEIALRTKGDHQLTGYAQKYLGKTGKRLMLFSMIFGIYSALVAYLIGEGNSFSLLFFGNLDHAFYLALAFWILLSFLVFIGLRALKKFEPIGMFIVILLIIIIFFSFSSKINPKNLSYVNPNNAFLPIGVILFAFLGFSALPELERILKWQEDKMKKAIIIGSIIPIIVYIIFAFVVVGYLGENVSEIATLSLGKFSVLLGIVTMFTAFFVLSIALRDMYRFDFNFSKNKAWFFACFIPLILFMLIDKFNIFSFTQILSLAGTIAGGLAGILILLMIKKAKEKGNRKPEYSLPLYWPLIIIAALLLIAAVVSEILKIV